MLRETAAVSLARFDHPPGAHLPSRFSDHEAAENFRVNIVASGWFRLRHRGQDWTLGPRSIFLSRPTEVYGYAHIRNAVADACLRMEFAGSLAPGLADRFGGLPLVLPATNRLAYLGLRLGAVSPHVSEMALDALACELLDAAQEAARECHRLYRPEQLKRYAQRIGSARELIDSDPAAPHSLWRLSYQVGVSPFFFARLFRELVGMPPHKYVVQRRLERARDLLKAGMRVTDACYAAGFNNLSHFIHTFRRHFGMVPSRLRAH